MSILCLRTPKPIDLDDPAWKQRRIRPQWLAFADLLRAYRLALAAPGIGFEIVTVVGETSRRLWDLTHAEALLGFRPPMTVAALGHTPPTDQMPLSPAD